MSTPFALDTVLAVGVDPHRESLDVIAIHFPEEIVLDEAFDNTRAGHRALWSKAQALADEKNLSLIFGLEDGCNYGYALGRYLVNQGGCVKEVNPRMTNRQRDFYGEDKTNRLDALHFWATYPTPAHLRATTPEELADFFREKSKYTFGVEAARHKARQIFNALDDAPLRDLGLLAEAQGTIIRDLAQRLLHLKRSIESIEAKLEKTVPATGQQLETFQGIGIVSAAVLVGETRDTARFHHDKDRFAKYNGSAPVTKGSGKHARQVENHWCNRRLKSTLGQVALAARHNEPLSAAYYQACLDRGLDPGEAHKRLMRRLSDIIFAMMRDKTPYDLEIHRRKRKGKSVAPAVAGD